MKLNKKWGERNITRASLKYFKQPGEASKDYKLIIILACIVISFVHIFY
jgi:hypothetical protein